MSDQGDTGYADQLASRIDVGDPDPKKEILRFLRVPYLLSERVLKLARDNQAFHVLGIVLARQALRLVLLLNAKVSKDGPNRAQLDERIKLQESALFPTPPATIVISQLNTGALNSEIVDLEAVFRELGSYPGRNQLEDSASKRKQQHGLVTFDSNRDQKLSIVSEDGRVKQPSLNQDAYQQRVSQIKTQYDLFFPPSAAREENFNVLLNYDKNSTSFGAWQQSRCLGQVGDATADSIGQDSIKGMYFKTTGMVTSNRGDFLPIPMPEKTTTPIAEAPSTPMEIPTSVEEPRIDGDDNGFDQQPGGSESTGGMEVDSTSQESTQDEDFNKTRGVTNPRRGFLPTPTPMHANTTINGAGALSPSNSRISRMPLQTMRHEPTNGQRLATIIQQHQYHRFCSWTPSTCSINGKMWHRAAFSYAGYTILPPNGGWHENAAAAREETALYALPYLVAHLTPARQ